MDFLQQSDYKSFINPQLLNMLLEGDEQKLVDAENMAYGFICDNLASRYNMRTEFSKTSLNRNSTLVRWMLSLSVYFLHNTVPDTEIPERVAKNYDDTRKEIINIASGRGSTTLIPLVSTEGKQKTRFRWGSSPRRTHNPFE